ncbi:hypothetical protein NON20_08170 [Synechocystis sp. B12]|nr:hypothetical protein NON20_08170 [Synechocystis sp. B12]
MGVAPALYFYRRAGEDSRSTAVSRLKSVIEQDKADLAAIK